MLSGPASSRWRAKKMSNLREHNLGLVLTGGGARAAYQVGFLLGLTRLIPELRIPILTGVSAGAINAAFLANHRGPLPQAVQDLADLWRGLEVSDIFRVDAFWLLRNFVRWASRLSTGGTALTPQVKGFMDTEPLRQLLHRALATRDGRIPGIQHNLSTGRLRSLALLTVDYATGRTVTWVEGRDVRDWERPRRLSRSTEMTVEHVMASAALPLLFPAVRLENSWYGDGGIRMAAPLAPAIHLGADRVLAISTLSGGKRNAALEGYPPPAQIAGSLLNAIFLDVLDQDARMLERINALLRERPLEHRGGLREVGICLMRPTVDLGRMSVEFEPDLPRAFRFFTRGLGTRETSSPDLLSLLMFHPGYLTRLIEIGENDAAAHVDEVRALVKRGPES